MNPSNLSANDNLLGSQCHHGAIGIEVSSITYKEPGYMKESGGMLGVFGSYRYHNKVMLQIEGSVKYGQVKYEGMLQNRTPLSINKIDDYIFESRVLGGYDFHITNSWRVTPFVGLGYRRLLDNMGESSIYGYDRESNYLYSPIGLQFLRDLSNEWYMGMTLEYDFFWRGLQKSQLSDIRHGYNTIKNNQNSGYGIRASIKFQKRYFLIEPFVKYWSIQESDRAILTFGGVPTGSYCFEPKNNSTELGLKVVWRF